MEYSKLASGQVSSLGGNTPVVLPFIPNFIEISNKTRRSGTNGGVTRAWWETDMGQGAAFLVSTLPNPTPTADLTSFVDAFGGAGSSTGFTAGTGFQTFSAGFPQLGNAGAITGITAANPAVVTTAANHNLVTGNVVILTNIAQTATTGMQQIAGFPFVVTVLSATTFSIPWNASQSNYTAITAGGLNGAAVFRQVLFPYLYFPGVSYLSAVTQGTSTTFTTTTNHNLVVGNEVAFRISQPWGMTQLNTPSPVGNFGFPLYGFVTSVPSATSVVVNINSSSFTAFNSNPTVSQALAGLTPPQLVAVGDNNTGGLPAGTLFPPPTTINPNALAGAFQVNTSQGFIIGSAVAGTAADVLYWRAYAHDLSL